MRTVVKQKCACCKSTIGFIFAANPIEVYCPECAEAIAIVTNAYAKKSLYNIEFFNIWYLEGGKRRATLSSAYKFSVGTNYFDDTILNYKVPENKSE